MKKWSWIVIAYLSLIAAIHGQVIDSLPISGEIEVERPKVGLVLSGGSAHGLAHIGVIQLLEELEIPIDYITGTSMGAIIGALKAMGRNSDDMKELTARLPWQGIINNRISLRSVSPSEKYYHEKYPLALKITNDGLKLPLGFVNSSELDMLISNVYSPAYKIRDFDNLPIPYKCYTVDIVEGKVYEMDSGNLGHAVRTSMSIPSLFPPVEEDGKLFVDGGIMRNFPAQEVKNMGADIVIGSYVGAQMYDLDKLNSFLGILRQAGFLLSFIDYDRQVEYVDILIQPQVKDFSSLDFSLKNFFVKQGYIDAVSKKDELIKMRDSLGIRTSLEETPRLPDISLLFIDSINTPYVTKKLRGLILDKLEIEEQSYTSIDKITYGLNNISSTKSFYNNTYFLEENVGKTILSILSKPIREANILANINRYSSTGTSIIVGARLKNFITDLTDVKVISRVSEYPGIYMNVSSRGNFGTNNFVYSFDISSEAEKVPFYVDGSRRSLMEMTTIVLQPQVEWEYSTALSFLGNYRLNYDVLSNALDNKEELKSYKLFSQQYGGSVRYNSLNKQNLPTKGIKSELKFDNYFNVSNKYGYRNNVIKNDFRSTNNFVAATFDFRHIIPFSKVSFLEYSVMGHWRNGNTLTNVYSVGGTYQDKNFKVPFIGFNEGQGLYGSMAYGRLSYSYHFADRLYMSAVTNIIYGDNVLHSYYTDQVAKNELIVGYGVSLAFNLRTGPIYLDIGSNTLTHNIAGSISLGHRHIF